MCFILLLMKIQYFALETDRYPIDCKMYVPDHGKSHHIVLGVHGFAGDKESSALYALAKELTKKQGQLVCFDWPGHGKSPVDGQSLTVDNCIKDLKHMLAYCRNQFPSQKKYVFATSFGGYITLLCKDTLMRGDTMEFQTVLRAPAVTMPQLFLSLAGLKDARQYRALGSIQCGFPGQRELWVPYVFFEQLQQHDVFKLDYTKQSFLVIHGKKDVTVPYEDVRKFCQERRSMKLYSISGADHRFKEEGQIQEVVQTALRYWKIEEEHRTSAFKMTEVIR
ncbi:MAG: alpha/beta fold hydrolase [Erysipelotrichaceae bacterium]|nr:alpha/beta fold hydrolase [Erysipelotrichaceae bacterium]